MRRLAGIFWLGVKEMRSLRRDRVLVVFLVYAFTLAVYTQATGLSSDVHNAAIAFVDEDRSALAGRLVNAFRPPQFKPPQIIAPSEIDDAMDQGRFLFVVAIPPRFEADLRAGRRPEIQIDIDATAMMQAGIGASYIQHIVADEVARFLARSDTNARPPVELVTRMAFNPNRNNAWFASLVAIVNQITMLTVILTGAALIREREHGTIEHLLAMPLDAFDIVASKVWSNALVILVATALSLVVVVQGVLQVPIAGSRLLFLLGTVDYLFFAAALGIFLGTVARSMAQFALLIIMVVMLVFMLSGGMTPVESQPQWLQWATLLLPSRHFVAMSQAIVYRGAGLDVVWPQFAAVGGLGLALFVGSLLLFRRSLAAAQG